MTESARQRLLDAVANRYAVAITPRMQDQVDPRLQDDPIAAQFLPDARELLETPDELTDPIGDHEHSPVTGIVHRYPDRALLMPVKVCPVYCRFCFRRETVGDPEHAPLGDDELDAALAYIRAHEEIWEVILSGGDPMILSPRRLGGILRALRSIDHVRVLRIHTRVPLVAPDRISDELVAVLRDASPLFVVLHSNHPNEFSDEGRRACARLVDAGIPMLSQSVLLRGINDDVNTLDKLLRQFAENRIKPYYLHHADKAPGTSHFRTTMAQGRELVASLRGTLSGICQPVYVLDIPGGYGKVPAAQSYLREDGDGRFTVTDCDGDSHRYRDTDRSGPGHQPDNAEPGQV